MIDKDEALAIAKGWLVDQTQYTSLSGPYTFNELPSARAVYRIFPEKDEELYFFILYKSALAPALRSSTLLLVSGLDGRIVGVSSANDEG